MRKQAQMRIYTLSRLKPDKTNDTQYSLWATACTYDSIFLTASAPKGTLCFRQSLGHILGYAARKG